MAQGLISPRYRSSIVIATALVWIALPSLAERDGLLERNGARAFPIGFYEFPQDDAGLAAMKAAGVNLVRCRNEADLDRAQAAGLMGWLPLPFDAGATDELKRTVDVLKDHPALAVWEGPDEVVWNFTAYSGLHKHRGVYDSPEEWPNQTPKAIAYSESQAARIIPNMRDAVEYIRSVDSAKRPIWINEALNSDVRFVRQYLPFVDVIGCDTYPVRKGSRNVASLGGATDRWNMVGKGKPVWMVLQAFSWHELGEEYADRGIAYPSFAESRHMAYVCITHGAKGLLYWGSQYLTSEPFRKSLYALTAELAVLQPFLVAPPEPDILVRLIEIPEETKGPGVSATVRRAGDEWLIILVNEDNRRHFGVEVSGLTALDGRELHLLYGDRRAIVKDGDLLARMQPFEVQVYTSSAVYESSILDGRGYAGE